MSLSRRLPQQPTLGQLRQVHLVKQQAWRNHPDDKHVERAAAEFTSPSDPVARGTHDGITDLAKELARHRADKSTWAPRTTTRTTRGQLHALNINKAQKTPINVP